MLLDFPYSRVAAYDNEIYLTFDTDWADDAVIRDTIELLDAREVPATVFVTHASPLLAGLAVHPRVEVGLHPNFNALLDAGRHERDAAAVLAALHEIYPGAVSVRSHSLFQSSGLQHLFAGRRLVFEVNQFIPAWSGVACRPYREITGMVRVPYFWEDDVHVAALASGLVSGWEIDGLLDTPGLKVFDFHPVHVFLNTEHMDRYGRSRDHLGDPAALAGHRCPTYGTRSFLTGLIDRGLDRGFTFRKVSEVRVA